MKKNKLPNLVVILVLTLVTGVVWISFSIYRALTTKPAPAVPEKISSPLNPTLDTQTLSLVKSSIYFEDSQIPEVTITTPSSAPNQTVVTPTSIPTPIASISATPNASPSATP